MFIRFIMNLISVEANVYRSVVILCVFPFHHVWLSLLLCYLSCLIKYTFSWRNTFQPNYFSAFLYRLCLYLVRL